jgi:peptidoglycan/LPS O-acetylase OafA/YrhL
MTISIPDPRTAHIDSRVTHLNYRAYIDGLRAIAVLSVIGFHAFPDWIFSGFVGVDIFFVISGFLISALILMNLERDHFSYTEFYRRRIKRIFPALIVVISACFAFGWYVLLPDEFRQLLIHMAAGAGFVSNFALWSEAGYFDNSAHTKPLLHLWSLSIEEQFYIVWPLAVGMVWRHKWNFLALTLVIAGISFALNVMTVATDSVAAFYSPFSRFWELMMGGSLAYLTMRHPRLIKHCSNSLAAIGLTAIGLGIFAIQNNSAFPGWWALLPTVGTFLLVAAGPEAWLNRRVLGSRGLVWVGLISYPLYLWHWPAFVFARIVMGRNLHVVERVLITLVSIVLAYITYQFLEKPIRSSTARTSRRVVTVLVTLAACIGSFCLLALGGNMSPRQSSASISNILAAAYDWDYPDGLKGKILAGRLRRAYAYSGNSATNTLFVGDSNMEQYYPRITKLISESPDNYNSALFVGNQRERCDLIYRIFVTDADACDSVRKDIFDLASRKDVAAIVLIYSGPAYHYLLTEGSGRENLSAFIRRYVGNGKRVYLVLNMPDGNELDPKGMFTGSRFGVLRPKEPRQAILDYTHFMATYEQERAELADLAAREGAHLIDPIAYLCPNKQCPIFDGRGAPLYKDSLHMRASYVRASASYIDVTLRAPTHN